MKRNLLILLFCAIHVLVCGQKDVEFINNDSSLIRIKGLYSCGYGKIFDTTYVWDDLLDSYKSSSNLTTEEIIEAEEIMINNYNEVLEKDLRFDYINPKVKDPKRHLKYYYRQYVGYINDEGEKMIFIHLLNFRNKKKAEKYFSGWKNDIKIGVGSFYDKNQKFFIVNLENKTLTIP